MKKLLFVLAIGYQLLAISFRANAQFQDLLDFHDFNGIYPQGNLTLSASGKLYGTTSYGGAYNYGCIFSMDTNGTNYNDIHDFNDINGAYSHSSLTLFGRFLYGMIWLGTKTDTGSVFSIDTNGSRYKIIHKFNTASDSNFQGNIIISDSVLYGMTNEGGVNSYGNIFSLDTNGSHYKDLWDFDDTGSNGTYPTGALTLLRNTLFGVANGGGQNKLGLIFSIDTNGSNYKDLWDFSGADTSGSLPKGSLTYASGKLYGMTEYGGANNKGSIFSIDTNGSIYKDLYDFSGVDTSGAYPHGSLTLVGSTLYGMAGRGGIVDDGCVFLIDTNGTGYHDLWDFNISDTDITNGAYPGGSLTYTSGQLFGMTENGGLYNLGLAFRLDTNRYRPTSSISEVKANESTVTVYPNPSTGMFNAFVMLTKEASLPIIEIYNILGEQVLTETLHSVQGDNSINISEQPNGIYLYRVILEDGNMIGAGKLIIQK